MDLNSSGPDNKCATLQVHVAHLQLRASAMKTALLDHLSLGPYKGSVRIVEIQMPFHTVGHSFHPLGGSYTPGASYMQIIVLLLMCAHVVKH